MLRVQRYYATRIAWARKELAQLYPIYADWQPGDNFG
jgi:hypothetical protein